MGAQLCPPLLLPLVFRASRQRLRPKRSSRSQPPPLAMRPLAGGWGGRRRRCKQMSATTCRLTPGRGPALAPALRPAWLRGGAAPVKARARELAARRGSGSGSEGRGDGSRRFDTLCLNFNDLIKDFNSAVNSANEPGAPSASWKESI